jgi:uncharacterized protein (DUF433 family)
MGTTVEIRKIPGLPVTQHPEVVSGAPVFEGTRVPVSTLFDYLADNYTLDEFLESFPSVRRDAALSVLQYGQNRIVRELAA